MLNEDTQLIGPKWKGMWGLGDLARSLESGDLGSVLQSGKEGSQGLTHKAASG